MNRSPRAVFALTGSVLLLGAIAAVTTVRATEADPFDVADGPAPFGEVDRPSVDEAPEAHWTERHLQSLEAEARLEKSIYLAAVQLVELERERGDLSAAVTTLKDIATRAGSQQLRNAVNRLLFDIARERGDLDEARNHLDAIIEESLSQQ